jgi:DNA repair exonuclease SbcCD ATPase subunit
MKKFELLNLRLNNFKGVKDFELNAEGKDLTILGDNQTGKTTLFDGFIWLLFGKDSMNKSNFEIKTLDETGKVKQHGINHEVEGTFRIDDNTFSLKRTYSETWTKKKGSAKESFTGHSTEYSIDGVPVRKKDYNDRVNEIVSEDIFKLLTNPSYFNQQLGWKERRDILLSISGDVTDEEVAAKSENKDLAKFVEQLNGRNVEDHKKVIRSKQKEVNDELDRIPVRIDEIQLSLPDTNGLDQSALTKKIETINQDIEEKKEIITNIRNGGEVSNKRKELSDIELQIATVKNEHDQEGKQDIFRSKASIQENESNFSLLESKVKSLTDKLQGYDDQEKEINQELQTLRSEWSEINAEVFEHDQEDCTCPTCKQDLPSDQVEQARAKAEEDFNRSKAKRLEAIQAKGKTKGDKIESIKADRKKSETEKAKLQDEIDKTTKKVEKQKKDLEALENTVTDITENQKYVALLKEKEKIKNAIEQLKESVTESIDPINQEITELEIQKKEVQDDLNKFDIASKSSKRLDELDQQEKQLSEKYEELEKELFLSEAFTREKVNLLEEKINSKFKYATFKLFEDQLNGGLKETCETLYEGIPYNNGLNNASRINVGLDIINTLNDYYEVYAPIFIDNAEAVTQLIKTESQSISLVVSDQHSQLEVQAQDSKKQTA